MHGREQSILIETLALLLAVTVCAQAQEPAASEMPRDPAAEAMSQRKVPVDRPEQRLTEHDRADIFDPTKPAPLTDAFKSQPKAGRITGFDFSRDPLGADKPFNTFAETLQAESGAKASVMAAQRRLLEKRYNLKAQFDPQLRMSRGKAIAIGPTARLPEGLTWESLDAMSSSDIKAKNLFPYPSLPHPLQVNGGQVFPQTQTAMFPRLERFDPAFPR
jgi:hypothetical protein